MDVTLTDPRLGLEVDRRYTVQSRIAEGGMATVYLALDRRLDRRVAFKVMHADLAQDGEFVERFVREARSAARLSHQNVVQVFDQGSDGDILYLAMEYLPGRTLRDALLERGALTPREALAVLEPVLDALSAAHQAGIVHRDVKPENVILTDDGRIKVADFGLARAAAAPGVSGTNTGSGPLIGTVAYLAPELVSLGITDARTDVYAVGIMLFELLTGRQPFTAEDPVDVALLHVHEDVPVPSTLADELPEALDDVVAAATARDPADRPEDAQALLRMLRAVHQSLPDDVLDLRVVAPARPAGGDETEVLSGPTAQPTRALVIPRDRRAPAPDGAGRRPLLRGRFGRRALIAVLAVVALLLGGAIWYTQLGPGAYTTMPSVTGIPVAQAEQALTTKDLKSQVESVFDAEIAAGRVVDSTPDASDRVRKNATVLLSVSKGPELAVVPTLVGLSRGDAEKALEGAGLGVGDLEEQYGDEPSGQVIGSSPEVGDKPLKGSKVDLTVSKGPKPVAVPDVRGKPVDAAVKALKDLGFMVKKIEDPAGKPPGVVLLQSPVGENAPAKSEISITVAPGVAQVAVPSVGGYSPDDAARLLTSQGFVPQFSGPRILNRIVGQNPAGGTLVDPGSVVRVQTF